MARLEIEVYVRLQVAIEDHRQVQMVSIITGALNWTTCPRGSMKRTTRFIQLKRTVCPQFVVITFWLTAQWCRWFGGRMLDGLHNLLSDIDRGFLIIRSYFIDTWCNKIRGK